jgi:hypothetical protein
MKSLSNAAGVGQIDTVAMPGAVTSVRAGAIRHRSPAGPPG